MFSWTRIFVSGEDHLKKLSTSQSTKHDPGSSTCRLWTYFKYQFICLTFFPNLVLNLYLSALLRYTSENNIFHIQFQIFRFYAILHENLIIKKINMLPIGLHDIAIGSDRYELLCEFFVSLWWKVRGELDYWYSYFGYAPSQLLRFLPLHTNLVVSEWKLRSFRILVC